MQPSKVRPTGITILVILEAIISALLVLSGLALALLGPLLGIALPELVQRPIPSVIAAVFFTFFGVVLLIIGIVGFIVAWGLWTGQGWAWTLAFILAVIGIVLGLFRIGQGGIIDILIDGIIAWYLWQPHVKAFYGKGPTPPSYSGGYTPSPPTPPQVGTVIYCGKCGTANPPESRFCRNCGAEIKT
ncbi:MAG: zinc-ribbon domain-containing protein [Candidatus Bathyarchaeia archaeon]